jgi:Na+/phosphate symporter
MPGIASVNYTAMQGDAAREMQNIKNMVQDANQNVIVAKVEKNEAEKRETVQESEDTETSKLKAEREKKDKEKRRRRREGSSENDQSSGDTKQQAATPGGRRSRLLDIVA